MMSTELLLNNIEFINTRKQIQQEIIAELIHSIDLLNFGLQVIAENGKSSDKMARAVELCCLKKTSVGFLILPKLLKISEKANRDAVIRPLSKIYELVVTCHYKKFCLPKLEKIQQEKLIEICFDWLISPQKTAAQVYSMQTLFLLGQDFDWVHSNLKEILKQNFSNGSKGYKARSKKILTEIEKYEKYLQK